MRTRHPVTEEIDFEDHAAMAARWGAECRRAVERALADPAPATIWDHDLDHAWRSAKMAWWHADKVLRLGDAAKKEGLI